MNPYNRIILILLTICLGCNSTDKQAISYIEAQPSFYNLRHGDQLKNYWIRDPRNLLMLHETFKKVGYHNLLKYSQLNENPFILQGVYINRPLFQIIDSLEITYKLDTINEKYYREFWQRRKAEDNDSIVYIILKELKDVFRNHSTPNIKTEFVNDTLYNLLYIEFRSDTLNNTIATENLNRLKMYGFHQSVYNLLYESYEYSGIQWNKDSIQNTLTKSDKRILPWFEDNTK
jgi:hypothetical protein